MSYLLEVFGRSMPDSLWPVFREHLKQPVRQAATEKTTITVLERTSRHIQGGIGALQRGDGGQAKEHFDRALSLRQGEPAAILGMACALDMLGQPEQSMRYLEVIRQRSPEDARVHFAMGLLEERCNRPDSAREFYQKSVYFHPHQRGSRQRLMAIAMAQGDHETALQQAEALAAQFPLELPAWTRLGGLYLLVDDPKRASNAFEQALKLLADNWQSETTVDPAKVTGEQWQDAVAELKRALEHDGDYADLHVRLGDLYAKRGMTDKALAEYREAIRISPYYLEATTKIAAGHVRAGRRQEGATWLAKAIQVNETLLLAYVGQALAQAYMGRDSESSATLKMARGIAANSPVLMAEVARLHEAETAGEPVCDEAEPAEARQANRAELLATAIRSHLAWLTQNDNDAAAWMRLGMLLEADKQPAHARQAYERAVEIYPACAPALARLGLAGSERDSATSGMLRRTIWPEKIDLGVHYNLAVLFGQSQRFEITAEKFVDTLAGGAKDSFWRNVALCLEQMALLNGPKGLWQSLRELNPPEPAEPVQAGEPDAGD